MHCFHASIIHFLWFLYIAHINNFPQLSFSHIHRLFFAVPSEMKDRYFTTYVKEHALMVKTGIKSMQEISLKAEPESHK
jgi:hypothetical protein